MLLNFRCDKAEGEYRFNCSCLTCCPDALAAHYGGGRVDKAVGNLERKSHLDAVRL